MSIRPRALLTGATGFLGRRVLRTLVRDGWQVRCAVRPTSDTESLRALTCNESPAAGAQVEVVSGDLSSADFCRELLAGVDCVLHLAAALGGSASSLITNTVVPTRSLLNAAADCRVRRVILVSSLGVYGPQKLRRGTVLDEHCPLDASPARRDAYTYSKILQEEVARSISSECGLPLVVMRPGVIFGDERGVLSDRVGLRLGPVLLRMGGRQRIPFTYVENCAEAIVRAANASGIDGEVINILDDHLPTGREVIRRYRRSGRTLHTIGVPRCVIGLLARFNEWYADYSQAQIPAVLTRHRTSAMWKPLRYSNERARRLLNWSPAVSMDEAFERTLNSTPTR